MEHDGNAQQCLKVPQKLYIVDINKRKLSGFDEFAVEILGSNSSGEADLIAIGKPVTKVKIPVCILYGVSKGILGIDKRTRLGY